MSCKVGQIVARGERRWLVRVYLGRDRETRKRSYHNETIYGSLRHAQAYLTRRLHERDLSRGVEGLQVTVDEFLDHWLKMAVRPKVRAKTYSDYAAMLRRSIRPAIGARIIASLSPLEIQAAYQVMIEQKLSARTVRYAHAVLRAAIRQAIRWQLLLNDPTQGVELPREQCREMSVLTTEAGSIVSQDSIAFPTRVHFCSSPDHWNAIERISRHLLAGHRLGSWNHQRRSNSPQE
jgi:integrase